MKSNRIMPLPRKKKLKETKSNQKSSNKIIPNQKNNSPKNQKNHFKANENVNKKTSKNEDLDFEIIRNLRVKEKNKKILRCTVSESHISAETSSHYPKTGRDVLKNFKKIHKSALFSDIMKPLDQNKPQI